MHRFLIAAVAAVVAIGTLAMPTEAAQVYRSNGWHVVKSAQRSVTVTLKDRTPRRTYVFVSWAKKPGTSFCRARVTFTKNGLRQSRVFYKYSRDRSKSGIWVLSGRGDRTIRTNISTNGNCVVWAAVS